jgi:hypothetical protein
MIGAAVTHPAKVMRFKIRRAVYARKWRCCGAPLAFAFGSGQDVIANISAPLIHVSHAL